MCIIQLKDEMLKDVVGGGSYVEVSILRDPISPGRQPDAISVTEPARIGGHGPDVHLLIPPVLHILHKH